MSDRRIRTERNGGAWCPKQAITRESNEWIEIDLQELKVITQVETQGRFGNGQVRWLSQKSHLVPPNYLILEIRYLGIRFHSYVTRCTCF